MFHTGLKRYENADINSFTSNIGLRIRKVINPLWRRALRLGTKRKMILETYPKLDKKKAYIFVANHSLDEDIISVLQTIDRNVYLLHGTTDQMEHIPVFLAVWLNGMIFVNRLDQNNRKEAVQKMKRVLAAGNSVVLFPEGGYNNTENQLIMPLFSSPYLLSKEVGVEVEVVPIISFNPSGSDKIYMRAGNPINLAQYDKHEAMTVLRDEMGTIVYQIMEEHTVSVKRRELGADPRTAFMEERKNVYECQKWHWDVWDEELTRYPGHGITTPQQAREYVDKVQVNLKNTKIIAGVLVRREEDKRYDLKEYLRRNISLHT